VEEEAVFHDCLDSDGLTDCSDEAPSESPWVSPVGEEHAPDPGAIELPSAAAVPQAPAPVEWSPERPLSPLRALSPLNGGMASQGRKRGAWLAGFLQSQKGSSPHRDAGPALVQSTPEVAATATGCALVPRRRTLETGTPLLLPAPGLPGTPSRCSPSLIPRSRSADNCQGPEIQPLLSTAGVAEDAQNCLLVPCAQSGREGAGR